MLVCVCVGVCVCRWRACGSFWGLSSGQHCPTSQWKRTQTGAPASRQHVYVNTSHIGALFHKAHFLMSVRLTHFQFIRFHKASSIEFKLSYYGKLCCETNLVRGKLTVRLGLCCCLTLTQWENKDSPTEWIWRDAFFFTTISSICTFIGNQLK